VLFELGLVVEMAELSVEAQFGLVELFEEESAEESGQDAHWKKEVLAVTDLTRSVGAGAATGNNAVDVRMVQQVLAPGVQDREEADLGPQVFGVRGDGEECLRAGSEEDAVEDFLVLQC